MSSSLQLEVDIQTSFFVAQLISRVIHLSPWALETQVVEPWTTDPKIAGLNPARSWTNCHSPLINRKDLVFPIIVNAIDYNSM